MQSPSPYGRDEGVGTLANTLTKDPVSQQATTVITSSLRAIYNPNFSLKDFNRYSGVDSFISQRIQNWYLIQRLNHTYSHLHETEAKLLSPSYSAEVESRNQKKRWSVKPHHEKLLEDFRKDIHYGLKNYVEILARSLVEQKILATGVYRDVRVYLASDADDILSGIDLIVECRDATGKIHYIGVDIAVSGDNGYLSTKTGQESANPNEFFYRKGQSPRTSIPRIVFALDPVATGRLIQATVQAFSEGRPINPKFISENYSGRSLDDNMYGVRHLVTSVLNNR